MGSRYNVYRAVAEKLWQDKWAALFLSVYNLLGNLPFIIIQRFNRPRLVRLAKKKSGKLRLV